MKKGDMLLECLITSELEQLKIKFWEHVKANAFPEAVCIGVCELGEWGGELAGYLADIKNYNEGGLVVGIAAGASYAFYHVYTHAKKHGVKPSIKEAAKYAISAESGCVIGATSVEYGISRVYAPNLTPVEPINALIKLASFPVAYIAGLSIMSAMTFFGDKIISIVGAKGDLISKIKDQFSEEYIAKERQNRLVVKKSDAKMAIIEKDLRNFVKRDVADLFPDYSAYVFSSRVNRRLQYSAKKVLEEESVALLNDFSKTIHVHNPYSCSR